MNFVRHIRINLFFLLKLLRDAVRIILFQGRVLQSFTYKGDLFDEDSELQKSFDRFRAEICSTLGSNFFIISYKGSSFKIMMTHYIFGSQLIQMVRWYISTRFLRNYSDDILEKFYNGSAGRSYCGILKLNNTSWLLSRIRQFEFIEDFFDDKRLSYIEVGGSSGVLPLFAAYRGYEFVVNSDYSDYDTDLSAFVADRLLLQNFSTNKDANDVNLQGKFDVVSCHQVIEHTSNPYSFLEFLTGLMSPEGLIILSHGYHLPAYPGHIPCFSEHELEQSFSKLGLVIVAKSVENVYFLKNANC